MPAHGFAHRTQLHLSGFPRAAVHHTARLLARADLIVLNAAECRRLVGERAGSVPTDVSTEAAQLRREIKAPTVVVTMGAQGALIMREDGELRVPAPEVQVVDTTGAGDGFIGALAAGIASGSRCVAHANGIRHCPAIRSGGPL